MPREQIASPRLETIGPRSPKVRTSREVSQYQSSNQERFHYRSNETVVDVFRHRTIRFTGRARRPSGQSVSPSGAGSGATASSAAWLADGCTSDVPKQLSRTSKKVLEALIGDYGTPLCVNVSETPPPA